MTGRDLVEVGCAGAQAGVHARVDALQVTGHVGDDAPVDGDVGVERVPHERPAAVLGAQGPGT